MDKMNAAKSEQTAKKIRGIFYLAAVLQLTNHMWPIPPRILDEAVYDYIIVGGGTAGCVIASRLVEMENVTVLLIEAGGYPPMESAYPRYFPYLKQSVVDWNMTSSFDTVMKYHKRGVVEIPQGKMLGGTSNLNYMIYGHGNIIDYTSWATVANDTSWLFEEVHRLFKKNEHLTDTLVVTSPEEDNLYGTKGRIKLRRFFSESGLPYLEAFRQMGHKILLNINYKNPLGFSYCLFTCGKKRRQDTANSFLRHVKFHSRLHIMTHALVTKIILNAQNSAVGVNVLLKNKMITVISRREIILSAGVFKTPQLLMLSGIGPKKHLRDKKIKVRVDLPVGETLQVSPVVITVFKMGDPAPINKRSNPTKIEFPVIDGNVALHSHDFPDYVVRSIIVDDPAVFLELCVITFSYTNQLCDTLHENLAGKQIFLAMNHLTYPKSRGRVLLGSTDIQDQPIIHLGLYSNKDDWKNHATFLMDFHAFVNTTFFRKANGRFMDPNVLHCNKHPVHSILYWKCYASALVSSAHNYASTCAVGKVVDSDLLVKGVNGLRIVDASVIPVALSAPIAGAVVMIAEKAAEAIISNRYY